MDTRFWGPSFWSTCDFICFNYPVTPTAEDKKTMSTFFKALAPLLPCGACRDEFSNILRTYPVDKHLDSRDAVSRWMVEVHNRVNERLGKPRVGYDQIAAKYNAMRGTCEMRQSEQPSGTNKNDNNGKKCQRARTLEIVVILVGLAAMAGLMAWWFKTYHSRNRGHTGAGQ